MDEATFLNVFYLILCLCIIYPPTEFVSAGFTIESVFTFLLGSEDENFINYHVKRSLITLLVYSVLPLGYTVIFLSYDAFDQESLFWKIFFTSSFMLPVIALIHSYSLSRDNFKYHPVAINLAKFCNNNNRDWKSVASDINIEFRRVDKVCLKTSPLVKVVVTENWILKVTAFKIMIAHQSDVNLVVKSADTHQMSVESTNEVQYITVEVKSQRRNVETFTIRLISTDFGDLQDRVGRNIAVLPDVKFHKSVLDQFIEVFKDTIKNNSKYGTTENLELCIGCMQNKADVKLQKLCENSTCQTCYCKPLWCVDCMAQWFASRQDPTEQDSWLTKNCSCPMCRSMFCLLDVCLIHDADKEE